MGACRAPKGTKRHQKATHSDKRERNTPFRRNLPQGGRGGGGGGRRRPHTPRRRLHAAPPAPGPHGLGRGGAAPEPAVVEGDEGSGAAFCRALAFVDTEPV